MFETGQIKPKQDKIKQDKDKDKDKDKQEAKTKIGKKRKEMVENRQDKTNPRLDQMRKDKTKTKTIHLSESELGDCSPTVS
jgi:hypothetical protein